MSGWIGGSMTLGVLVGLVVCQPLLGLAQIAPPPQQPATAPAGQVPAAGLQQAGGNRQGVPLPARAPQAPFQLTPEQQAALDRVLQAWEQRSEQVQTFRCEFIRWEYDPVFGKTDANGAVIPVQHQGRIRYAKPDKGLYQVTDEGGEHWVCNGQSIFEFNHQEKKLIERILPPELQGKAITDGPLPFVFGANANKLRQRYFMRLVTPQGTQGQVWIEAWPKFQADAANFHHATLILSESDLLPFALEIYLTNGKNRTVHQFNNIKDNDPWRIFQRDFSNPDLPAGYTKIVENPSVAAQQPRRSAAATRRQQQPPISRLP